MSDPAAEPIAHDRWIGSVIDDKFRIDALIGEGAMGRVYRGEQLSLGKPVAIKVLHAHLGGDPRIAKRFHREAKAASRLSHPNSLAIIDFGAARDGTLFIAMELLEGEDLQTIIDHEAPLTPARITSLTAQTLRALDEAHHAGIIHRDLKPENVVVLTERSGKERVKVCDFGIAKIVESEGKSTAITKDGYVCGTPEYMAPEQAKGDAIDLRADIYSAGVMLYQMLCGRVPFQAESALGIITRHVMEAPEPPRRVRPEWGIPRSLEAVAMKALAKAPDERWSSAAEMADALEEATRALGERASERLGEGSFAGAEPEEDEPAAPPPAPSSTEEEIAKVVAPPAGRGWLVALGVAVLVLGFGLWLWLRPGEPLPAASAPPEATATQASVTRPMPAPRGPRDDPAPPPAAPEEAPAASPTAAPDPKSPPPEPRAAQRRALRAPRAAEVEAPPEPREEPAAQPADDPFEEGRAAMLRGELAGAIARFEEAARAAPSSPRVQRELARAYMRAGDVARGIAAYRRYLALAPNAADRAIVERIIAQHGG